MVRWIQEPVEELLPTARPVGSTPSRFREPRAQYASPSLPQKKFRQRNQPKVMRSDNPMLKIGVDTNRYSDRDCHSQTEQTLQSCRMVRLMQHQEKGLLMLQLSGNTQHFTLYFELCFDLSVSFSAAYS